MDSLLAAYRQQQLERIYHGLGYLGDFAEASVDNSADASADAHALILLGLRGWLSLLDEVCLHWVQQPDVTREQVVRFLEQSLQAIVAATGAVAPTAQLPLADAQEA